MSYLGEVSSVKIIVRPSFKSIIGIKVYPQILNSPFIIFECDSVVLWPISLLKKDSTFWSKFISHGVTVTE